MTDNEEADLKKAIMRADHALRQKQTKWETRKAVAMVLLADAAIAASARLAEWVYPAMPR